MVRMQKICKITNVFLRIVIGFCLDGNTHHQECWWWTLCCVSPLWWRDYWSFWNCLIVCVLLYIEIITLAIYFSDLILLLKGMQMMACGLCRIELGRTAQYYFYQWSGFFAIRINDMLNVVVTAEGFSTNLDGRRWLSPCVEQSVPELVSNLYKWVLWDELLFLPDEIEYII